MGDIPLIEVKNLIKIYDVGEVKVPALSGITLSIEQGEFVAIMGASGSGKSTFMNIIGCLDRPSEGEYILSGNPISSLSKDELARIRNKMIGFVFQGFNLLSRTTALDNVEIPLLYNNELSKNGNKKKTKQLAIETLERIGLKDRLYHLPNQLSGGQQQRVAIARALVNSPSIILADEPTGNLDSTTSLEIMEVFKDLHRKGITIMLVTHEGDIARFAERIIEFKDGKVVRDDLVSETDPDSSGQSVMMGKHKLKRGAS
jgi:putative ABC transport system ATP-binding protein